MSVGIKIDHAVKAYGNNVVLLSDSVNRDDLKLKIKPKIKKKSDNQLRFSLGKNLVKKKEETIKLHSSIYDTFINQLKALKEASSAPHGGGSRPHGGMMGMMMGGGGVNKFSLTADNNLFTLDLIVIS